METKMKIQFEAEEGHTLTQLLLTFQDKPFFYDLRMHSFNAAKKGYVIVDKSNLVECENIIKQCKVKVTSTAIYNEEMSRMRQ